MKANEVNHEKYLNAIQKLVGTELNVNFKAFAQYMDVAGKCKIVDFQKYDDFKIDISTWEDSYGEIRWVEYGTIKINFIDTKKYKGKTFTFEISLYTGLKYTDEYLFISTKKLEDNKWLQAYRFNLLEV